jgi:hypothetical protein
MNGAIAELWANISNSPSNIRTINIGINHQSFRSQKKETISETIPIFPNKRSNIFAIPRIILNQNIETKRASIIY